MSDFVSFSWFCWCLDTEFLPTLARGANMPTCNAIVLAPPDPNLSKLQLRTFLIDHPAFEAVGRGTMVGLDLPE